MPQTSPFFGPHQGILAQMYKAPNGIIVRSYCDWPEKSYRIIELIYELWVNNIYLNNIVLVFLKKNVMITCEWSWVELNDLLSHYIIKF